MEFLLKTVTIDQHQHSFSFADEVFNIQQGHDGSTDFNSVYDESAYDRISPQSDQVGLPDYDMDTKWRSVSIARPSQSLQKYGRVPDDSLKCRASQVDPKRSAKIPDVYKIEVSPTNVSVAAAVLINDASKKSVSTIKVPEEPFLLFLSHFETCVLFSRVSDLIEKTFEKFPEVSYEFVAEECMWNAIYLRGSSHCKIQINVYTRGSSHIVEGNRLSGDGAAFRAVFSELKATIQTAYCEAKCPEYIAISLPLPSYGLSEIDSSDALKPVLLMAKSGKVDSQLEASRMICDLSLQDDMQQLLCDSGCLLSLVEDLLPRKDCEWTHQHALFALANLSEAQSCQRAMIDAGVLPTLLALATDGPYHSAEVSRESARILANISSCMATRVVHVLGPGAVLDWIGSVDMLRDERLKLHASRAKEYLIVAAV